MGENHHVYSARTMEQGLTVLNKARGNRGWDNFVNEAVAGHYGLNLGVITLPPSRFLEEQRAKREAREAEKAAKQAKREEKTGTRKAAEKTEKKQKSSGEFYCKWSIMLLSTQEARYET